MQSSRYLVLQPMLGLLGHLMWPLLRTAGSGQECSFDLAETISWLMPAQAALGVLLFTQAGPPVCQHAPGAAYSLRDSAEYRETMVLNQGSSKSPYRRVRLRVLS